ncbi:TetR/AcrR family transcriptional regulator [Streptomyces sp. NBC_00536]|uniref:TetR/AcrR family transcriptional regulator n=1 Tax=Streptomyces sp. NBC_00536 TaxID=2975769 RepID=UPI002E816C03|nr:TetR/AcrR family transcriptional regulator [Streptomyces sp. NBC_00536]WUC78473.1 TetR/AcrR family transcriptional regulator [Streptomyces sp. NBC_00536]
MSTNITPRTGGRLRNEEARQSVLEATAALLLENGYGALTIEGVAKRANVAKSTVYRWWKGKPELVMDASVHTPEADTESGPEPDTGTLAGDLTAFLADLYATAGDPVRARALTGLAAEAQLDPGSAAPFRAWARTRRDLVRALFARAVAREEIDAATDPDRAADLVLGPFWYRLLVEGAAPDPADAGTHVASVLQRRVVSPE